METIDSQINNATNPYNMLEMMEQLGINNPRLKMIAEMMTQQSTLHSNGSSNNNSSAQKKQTLNKVKKIIEENELLKQENQQLLQRNDNLASALGACPDCWGEEADCRICRGRGAPGFFSPDKGAFSQYVLPVVKQVYKFRRKKQDKTNPIAANENYIK